MASRIAMSILSSLMALSMALPAVAAGDDSGTAHKCHAQYSVKWTPIIAKPSGTPWLFKGSEGKYHLSYELLLTNFINFDATIDSIEVIDAAQPEKAFLKLSADRLKKSMLVIGVKEETSKFAAGAVGVAFINVEFDSKEQVPTKLAHRIFLTTNHPSDVEIPKAYITAEVTVSFEDPPVIASPLRGEKWLSSGGYNGQLGHRQAIFPVDGEIKLAQRQAIDWIQLNAENQSHVGDPSNCESYVCYAQPLYSVCDGTVCGAIDKFPDQVPLAAMTGPVSEYPGGNSVTINMGKGLYAFYGHMKPGSILVKEGDVVKKGQKIGLLGNSGNSSEPHLHFHVSDSPIVLKADSKPYLFDHFLQVGVVNDVPKTFDLLDKGTAAKIEKIGTGEHQLELIGEGTVVNFQAIRSLLRPIKPSNHYYDAVPY